jgi:hypothetical protein
MRRSILVAALAAASLAVPGTALAGGNPPDVDNTLPVPPAVVPPPDAPVVDVPSAEAFAKLYIIRNRGTLVGSDQRRVRIVDTATRCLQHPVITTRFGCVFTLRAAVIQSRRGWDDWGHSARAASKRGGHHPRRVRVRNIGCLGALTINGGPTVQPTAQVRFIECARVPRGDWLAPEPA